MAAFVPADITSATTEGALLQIAQKLQEEEQNYTPAEGVARQNRVNVAINTDTGLATISATLPVTTVLGAGGAMTVTAVEYAVDA
ncbi:MAG: hypothetical protein AAFX78_16270 [Cyanobacteria bacterium J06638_20]